ncbi:hypothetical protein MP638_000207 [Amoeboaphelidium occidentale]|nr:hypothetical protein MP638_000207 [Amoeboaphelidium occidentale]
MSLVNFNHSSDNSRMTKGNDGNEYVLSDEQNEDFVCSRCGHVPKVLYYHMDDILCETCYASEPEATKMDDYLQRKLQKLKIVCPNSNAGCKRGIDNPFPASELQDHLIACEYQLLDCDFQDLGCNNKLPRVLMADHVLSCRFRNNADVIRFFKETKAGQLELKQKGSQLLSEVDLLKTKIKEQNETINDLKAKLEKLMKLVPESNDIYWKKTSSRYLHNPQFGSLCVESLDTEELDYNVDPQMFCKILSALKHNDKVKRLFLSSHIMNPASYPNSGLKNAEFNSTAVLNTFMESLRTNRGQGEGIADWVEEILDSLSELIEGNTTITNIQLGLAYIRPTEDLSKKLGKAISENLVLEELSFPVWAPTDPMFFHTIGPYIRKNKRNGGKLKTMKFFTVGLQSNAEMKAAHDQFQILLQYPI